MASFTGNEVLEDSETSLTSEQGDFSISGNAVPEALEGGGAEKPLEKQAFNPGIEVP